MPDQNDIVFDQYSIDLFAIIKAIVNAVGGTDVSVESMFELVSWWWSVFIVLSFLVAALCLFGYIYAAIRFNQLADEEKAGLKNQEHIWQELYGTGATKSTRLDDIEKHIQTDNPNDWKLAIIEADIILEEVLDKAGYQGTTVGEMLKQARASTMQTIDDAWEAHLVRNKVAHQGADFILTKKLALETIVRYKRVFAELGE